MARELFEGHIRIDPSIGNDDHIMAHAEGEALKFVRDGRHGTNLSPMIFNRIECDGRLTQVDFAVYADFP